MIDEEVVRLALLALAPASLDVSLEVAADIERQRAQLEAHWKSRLERAKYDADRARRQYDAVEPENRLVVRTLEQAWEEQLRSLQQLEQDYRRFQQDQPRQLSDENANRFGIWRPTFRNSGKPRIPRTRIVSTFSARSLSKSL